jgi:hypothetical protein
VSNAQMGSGPGGAQIASSGSGGSDADVISRQTLGAAMQEISFTVQGDSDECIEIEGFGVCGASANVAFKFNGTQLNVARISQVDGGVPSGSGTNAAATVINECAAFRVVFFTRRTSTCDRVAILEWMISYGAANEEVYWVGLSYHDTTSEVTTIAITGSVAATFGVGFRAIARRRRMAA